MNNKITYSDTGVDYASADPAKVSSQNAALSTSHNLLEFGMKELSLSRGESAYVWEEEDSYRSLVVEGLGTKNLIADEVATITGKTYYDAIAQDCVAMIVNDLIVVGALPLVINAYFGIGDGKWMNDSIRQQSLIQGWAKACNLSGATWGGGETPMLKGIINEATIDLAGSAVGKVFPKNNLVLGDSLKVGDEIVILESSGIHANGISFARKIVDFMPDRYGTKMDNGKLFGEALLAPTHIYVDFVKQLQIENIVPSYMVNITGHGWRKLMRAVKPFKYRLFETMEVQEEFNLMAKVGKVDIKEMYSTFNMGAGYAVFCDPSDSQNIINIANKCGFEAKVCGVVEEETSQEDKKLIIEPHNIVFDSKDLGVR